MLPCPSKEMEVMGAERTLRQLLAESSERNKPSREPARTRELFAGSTARLQTGRLVKRAPMIQVPPPLMECATPCAGRGLWSSPVPTYRMLGALGSNAMEQ